MREEETLFKVYPTAIEAIKTQMDAQGFHVKLRKFVWKSRHADRKRTWKGGSEPQLIIPETMSSGQNWKIQGIRRIWNEFH